MEYQFLLFVSTDYHYLINLLLMLDPYVDHAYDLFFDVTFLMEFGILHIIDQFLTFV